MICRLYSFSCLLNKVVGIAIQIALLLFYFSLPFFKDEDLIHATRTIKFFAFSYSVIILLLLVLLRSVLLRVRFHITYVDLIVFTIFVYVSLNRTLLQTVQPFSQRYFEFLGLGCLYVVLRNISNSTFAYLFACIALSGSIHAMVGWFQVVDLLEPNNLYYKVTGNFENPGPFAGYLLTVVPVAFGIYRFIDEPGKVQGEQSKSATTWINWGRWFNLIMFNRFFWCCLCLILISVLLITQSRAAWLSIIVVFIIFNRHFSFMWHGTLKINRKLKLIIIPICISIICTSIYYYKVDSADGRLLIWLACMNLIIEQPIVGIGMDRFKGLYMEQQASLLDNMRLSDVLRVADNVSYAFNDPLQLIVENGCIGGVLYCLLFLFLLRSKDRCESRMSCISKMGIVSILTFSLFSYPSYILPIKMNFLLFACYLAKNSKIIDIRLTKVIPSFRIPLLVLIAIFSIVAIFDLRKLHLTMLGWKQAEDTFYREDFERSVVLYERLYPLLNRNGEYLLEYGKALFICHRYSLALDVIKKAELYFNNSFTQCTLGDIYKALGKQKSAELAYRKAVRMVPSKLYSYYLLTRLLDESGQPVKACQIARQVIEMEVKVPSPAVDEIKTYMRAIVDRHGEVDF